MKKFLLTVLALVTVAVVSIVGTVAYLTWDDSDVNIMTMGDVKIKQNEYQWNDDATELVDYQNKALYPYVGELGWEKTDYEGGAYRRFSMNNALDKYVTVENTGSSDAFVRTIFAFEMGDLTVAEWDTYIGIAINADDSTSYPFPWAWDRDVTDDNVVVGKDGNRYMVYVAYYLEALKPNTETVPSLLQVYMTNTATNEIVERIDGNGSGAYEIYAISQAVQTAGFESAMTAPFSLENSWLDKAVVANALDTAFGEPMVMNAEATNENVVDWIWQAEQDYQETLKDTWDGTADISWYNETDTEFVITTAEQLAGLADLVDEGKTFEGKTVGITKDLDMSGHKFDPIGDNRTDTAFVGTFDGQNHKISNIAITGDDNFNGNVYGSKEGWGLFSLVDGATIKNVTVDGANFNSYTVITGAVAGYAYDTVFENITVSNAQISTYNWYSGGVVGWVGGESSFTNVTVDENTSVGTLWGSYDTPSGGIAGGASSSAKVTLKDCHVACVIDAVNDACSNYQWFAYRYTGMLIGNIDATQTIDGTTYPDPSGIVTCENVTVTYGDWVDYHYCESESYGKPSYADPGEWKFGRVEASDYATDGIDVSQCNHDTDESHNMLLTFDQLFGGGQGVYGLAAYDGVTVNYNK